MSHNSARASIGNFGDNDSELTAPRREPGRPDSGLLGASETWPSCYSALPGLIWVQVPPTHFHSHIPMELKSARISSDPSPSTSALII